jgi:arylformamidase
MKAKWIDVSIPLRTGMVYWPGDPKVSIERFKDQARGDSSTASVLSMSAHTGTHMDAPLHCLIGGKSLDQMPLEAVVGPARVIEIRDRDSIQPAELQPHRIRRGERILFKTYGAAERWRTPEFDRSYVYITNEAAQFLAARGVRTVGIDYLSVGGFKKNSSQTHQALLGAGVWVIEGLNLVGVKPGRYDMICLPLPIAGADGAPARALLRKR